jgi:hypothetical protein
LPAGTKIITAPAHFVSEESGLPNISDFSKLHLTHAIDYTLVQIRTLLSDRSIAQSMR